MILDFLQILSYSKNESFFGFFCFGGSFNMLDQEFERLYLRLRATYYRRMVNRIGTREGSLSATESFCVEIIYLLGTPTISKFAQFLNISLPNAAYKINRLIDKGYVEKAKIFKLLLFKKYRYCKDDGKYSRKVFQTGN
jgi:predicted HTH transcriptional regulator